MFRFSHRCFAAMSGAAHPLAKNWFLLLWFGPGYFARGGLTLRSRGTIVPLQAPARPPLPKFLGVSWGRAGAIRAGA